MTNQIEVKTRPCCVCGQSEIKTLNREAVYRWHGGENIERAFPEMGAGERELLITGTHPDCWDKLFPEEEE
jgi:hypothetical protein